MSASRITLFVVLGLLVIALMNGCSTYNSMVSKREEVEKAWSDVGTQYQRRSDLIPQLVATVKGQGKFEQKTLEAVISARAKATSVTLNADNLNDQTLKQFDQNQGSLSSALGRLLMISEQYPELKTNSAFTELRAELAGTANRITTAREDFNAKVVDYNKRIQTFPANIWAGLFGFSKKPYFENKPGTEEVPKINDSTFNF